MVFTTLNNRIGNSPRPMAAIIVPVCCLLSTAYCLGQTPASELRVAVADVERLPPQVRPNVRYLSLYAIPLERRAETANVVNYVVNALSRTRAITRLQPVGPTLLRLDAIAYTASAQELDEWTNAWGSLAHVDPYWHIQTEVAVGHTVDGRRHTGDESASPSTAAVTVDGGWVDLEQAARLRAATGSQGALLRADYFIARATTVPAYYQFTGIPAKEADFLKSLGVDAKVISDLRADAGANLFISGITKKPRRIVWSQGPLGGVYQTLDVQQVDATRDPIRRAVSAEGFELEFDAGEWFAMAPNGLWRTALYDAQGDIQQTVPDKIAKDDSDPAADGIVAPMISCIRCHQENGLRPFRDDQSRLLASGRVDLRSYDPQIVRRAAEFYDEPRLQRQMKFDRETYALAVARATGGMKPADLAESLGRAVREFAYLPVTRATAARELGLSEQRFAEVMASSHDPIILALIEGHSVLRGQWESSFAEAAVAVGK